MLHLIHIQYIKQTHRKQNLNASPWFTKFITSGLSSLKMYLPGELSPKCTTLITTSIDQDPLKPALKTCRKQAAFLPGLPTAPQSFCRGLNRQKLSAQSLRTQINATERQRAVCEPKLRTWIILFSIQWEQNPALNRSIKTPHHHKFILSWKKNQKNKAINLMFKALAWNYEHTLKNTGTFHA